MINFIFVAVLLLALLSPNLSEKSEENDKTVVKTYLRPDGRVMQWSHLLEQIVGTHRMLDLLTNFMKSENDTEEGGELKSKKRKNKKNKSNAIEPVDTEDFDTIDAGNEGKKKRKRKKKSQVSFLDFYSI